MTFDPQAFLNQAAGVKLDEQRELPAEGEYLAVASEPKVEAKTSKEGKPFYTFEISWSIQDQNELQRLGRDVINVRQQGFLDVKDDGSLDFGKQKNITLGQIFAALNMNDGSGSLGRVTGQMARIAVKHRPDRNNSERVFVEVSRVTKA